MAELAIGLFGALGTASTAAAIPAVGMLGTAAAPTLFSTTLGVLQGVTTAASMVSTLAGGLGAYSENKTMAQLSEAQATEARLAGEEKALRIRKEAAQKLGQMRVGFAGSGVDIGTGNELSLEDSLQSQAKFETSIEQNNANMRATMARMRARQYAARGEGDLLSAAFKTAALGTNYGISIARRG